MYTSMSRKRSGLKSTRGCVRERAYLVESEARALAALDDLQMKECLGWCRGRDGQRAVARCNKEGMREGHGDMAVLSRCHRPSQVPSALPSVVWPARDTASPEAGRLGLASLTHVCISLTYSLSHFCFSYTHMCKYSESHPFIPCAHALSVCLSVCLSV